MLEHQKFSSASPLAGMGETIDVLQARIQALEAENRALHGRVQALQQQHAPATAPTQQKTITLWLDREKRLHPLDKTAQQVFKDALQHPLRDYIHPVFQPAFDEALERAQVVPQQLDALVSCHKQPAVFARLTIQYTAVDIGWHISMSPIAVEQTVRILSDGAPAYRDIAELTGSYAYGIEINQQGHLIVEWVTAALTELTGYSVTDLLQWPDAQRIIHPDDLENMLQRVVQWHQGYANEGEYRIITRDGRVLWIMDRVQPIWDANQARTVRLYGLGHDVTTRKEAQLALEESQKRYQHLIESSFDLVQIVNLAGQFQFVNQTWQDTLGYTAEEWPHLTIWDILHPAEHEHCQQLLEKIYQGDYLPRIETRMVTKHGRVLRMAGSITPNFDQNKTVIGSNGFFHDITEQVNAAQALRQYADRLEILHNIDQAIISTESMEAIASNTLEYLRRLIPCDRVSITVLNAQGQVALLSYNGHTAETVSAGSATPYILQLLEQTISSPDKHFLLPDLNTVDISDVPPLQQLRQAGYQTYLGIPLLADNETIGLFNLNHREANFFQPEDIKIAQEVANHLAIALRQARLYEATQNQLKELRILHAVAQACAEAKTENELVNTVTKLFYAHDLADLFNVLLLNPETNHLYIHPGHEAVHPYVNLPPIPLNEGVTGRVAADQQARYIANTAVEPTYLDLGSHMLSELCVPLVSNGRVLGVLNAERRNTHSFDPFAQRLLTTISGQLSLTMERLRSARNTQRYAQQITTMNEMAQKMTRSLELDQVLQGIIDEVSALVQAEGVAVLLRPATNSDQLEFAAVSGPGARGLQKQHMPADQGIAGHVVRSGKPIAIHNRQQSAGLIYGRAENLSGFQSQSLLAVPIIVDNNTMGVLEAVHSQPNQFSSDSLNLLSAAATWAAIALKNAQLFTQLGEQYQQLQRSQAQLIQAEKLSALGRLVASIAHEINNPIQAIQGCLTLVTEELDRFAERETVDFYLDIVQTELVRVASIVKRMRDFYRPAKEGQFPTAVDDILASVLELSQKQLEYAQVQVSRDWSDDLPLILANPNHLKQVFLNLLLNAVDAMPDGGHLSIMARRATADQEIMLGHTAVVISFQDNGHGIPDTDREQLFEPFFTTKDEGSGLGLSISYNIIQAHNGHILVDSTIGQGTTFTILLPASDV